MKKLIILFLIVLSVFISCKPESKEDRIKKDAETKRIELNIERKKNIDNLIATSKGIIGINQSMELDFYLNGEHICKWSGYRGYPSKEECKMSGYVKIYSMRGNVADLPLAAEGMIENNERTGLWKEYYSYPYNKVQYVIQYKNDKAIETKVYYRSGALQSEIIQRNNKVVEVEYYETGEILKESIVAKQGYVTVSYSDVKTFYKSGKLKEEWEHVGCDDHGCSYGPYKRYDEDGNVIETKGPTTD